MCNPLDVNADINTEQIDHELLRLTNNNDVSKKSIEYRLDKIYQLNTNSLTVIVEN